MKTYASNRGSNEHHSRALLKYGLKNTHIIIRQCPIYLLNTYEIFLISFYDLTNPIKGYNKTSGGKSGYTVSKETRAKMSLAHMGNRNCLGRHLTTEHRNRISLAIRGKKRSDTTRANIAQARVGKKHTEETRAKLSLSKSGENHPMYGKKITETHRTNLSLAKTGENHPMYGKQHTEETRAKMKSTRTGVKKTAQALAKMFGDGNPNAQCVCAFGKVYGSAVSASNALRPIGISKSKDNFISKWIRRGKCSNDIFRITSEFYNYALNTKEHITLDIYTDWIINNMPPHPALLQT